MRFPAPLSTYQRHQQRKKKEQKERNNYDYSFNLLNPKGTIHLLLKVLLAIEMSPFNIGYSAHQNLDLRRLFDAVLYDRYGEGYENPRSYFKGRFQANPLDGCR
jgi:hypothetical protein